MRGRCVIDMSECECSCHYEKGVEHIRPCCSQCPHCGGNIKNLFFKNHVEECLEERKKLIDLLNQANEPTQ